MVEPQNGPQAFTLAAVARVSGPNRVLKNDKHYHRLDTEIGVFYSSARMLE